MGLILLWKTPSWNSLVSPALWGYSKKWCLWIRQWILTRHRICQWLEIGLWILQNCEKLISTIEMDHKESWGSSNWCFLTVVLEKTLENLLDSKEIKPINAKGNQPWIFIGRAAAEAEALILWPPDAKNWLIGEDPDAGKDWGQEEKGMTEDETVGWHHWVNEHEFEQTPGDGEGQGSLVCYCPWGHKELSMTVQLNNCNKPPGQWYCYSNLNRLRQRLTTIKKK